jgi:hypothetical protein
MLENNKICPRCRSGLLKHWKDLTSDEKFIIERLPAGAEFSAAERRTHLFCLRCHFEMKPSAEKA